MGRRIFILANGYNRRIPGVESKHLLLVGDDTVIGRTIRLLIEIGEKPLDIIVISKHQDVLGEGRKYGTAYYNPQESCPFVLDTITWCLQNLVAMNFMLYGDTVWSKDALTTVMELPTFQFIGSKVKHGGEVYGYSLPKEQSDWYNQCIQSVHTMSNPEVMKSGKNVWWWIRMLCHINPFLHNYDNELFIDLADIDDWTMDIDYQEDIDKLNTMISTGEARL